MTFPKAILTVALALPLLTLADIPPDVEKLIEANKYAEALARVDALIKENPTDAELKKLRADLAVQDPTTGTPAASARIPEDQITRFNELIAAGNQAEAAKVAEALAAFYPADPRLPAIQAKVNSRSSSSSVELAAAPAPSQLTGLDLIEYNTMLLLLQNAQQAADTPSREALLRRSLKESEPLTQKHPEMLQLWRTRAAVALDLDEPRVGVFACTNLLKLGAADSRDPALQQLLVQLNLKGWLDPGKVEAYLSEEKTATQETASRQRNEAERQEERERQRREAKQIEIEGVAMLEKAWANSLGMKFQPVDRTKVLFSVWETRRADYAAFAADRKPDSRWKLSALGNPDAAHPVTFVSWTDAKAFCEWLTKKERKESVITKQQEYRLPTDVEWSYAVGIGGEETEDSPKRKEADPRFLNVFPWGTHWPPPTGAGNYSPELGVDNYQYTSPVGRFRPNKFGLYDLGGNVWEWCEDWYEVNKVRVVRGGSFLDGDSNSTGAAYRMGYSPMSYRGCAVGFRIVLTLESER